MIRAGRGALARTPNSLRGIGFMLIAGAAGAVMNGIIRYLSAELHPFEIAFFRNALGLAVLTPLFLRVGLASLRTRRLGLHALRGLINSCAMLSFFLALSLAPLAEVVALGFTMPLFATLLAVLLLKERVGIRRIGGLAIGLFGALVIVRPGLVEIGPGTVLTLLSSVGWAVALIVIKLLSRTESSLTMTVYATLFVMPLSLVAALFVWTWPTLGQLGWLTLVGACGSLSQLALAQALHEAETTVVLPFDFAKLIWATLIGLVFFAELPDIWTYVGAVIVFASAIYIAYRESRLGRPLPKQPEP